MKNPFPHPNQQSLLIYLESSLWWFREDSSKGRECHVAAAQIICCESSRTGGVGLCVRCSSAGGGAADIPSFLMEPRPRQPGSQISRLTGWCITVANFLVNL